MGHRQKTIQTTEKWYGIPQTVACHEKDCSRLSRSVEDYVRIRTRGETAGCKSVPRTKNIAYHCIVTEMLRLSVYESFGGGGRVLNSCTSYTTFLQRWGDTAHWPLAMAFRGESPPFLGGSVDGSVSESSIIGGESVLAFSKNMKILKAVRQRGA